MQQSPAECLRVPSQAVVSSVDPGGLAEAAGFKVGDVIISMVSPLATVADELAPEVLEPLEPGMVCTVTIARAVIAPTVITPTVVRRRFWGGRGACRHRAPPIPPLPPRDSTSAA